MTHPGIEAMVAALEAQEVAERDGDYDYCAIKKIELRALLALARLAIEAQTLLHKFDMGDRGPFYTPVQDWEDRFDALAAPARPAEEEAGP